MRKFHPNNHVADAIAQLNLGCKRRLRFIYLSYTTQVMQIVLILHKQGVLRNFKVSKDLIIVHFKYYRGRPVCTNIVVVSKFSKRIYWSTRKLSIVSNKHNFTGFYILSTPQGYFTSMYCLLAGFIGGEVICKVEL